MKIGNLALQNNNLTILDKIEKEIKNSNIQNKEQPKDKEESNGTT